MTHTDLAQKIKTLPGLTDDERANLLTLLNRDANPTEKTYGLVWENKPEQVEEDLRNKLPILREVPERRITARSSPTGTGGFSPSLSAAASQLTLDLNSPAIEPEGPTETPATAPPHHLLIEGDNLHALTVLNYTHKGKVDVIYIDPPYNTGNKDFKYNDRFVDREDAYRHSKWLSFMHKRLELARTLLKPEGVIFISIDDNEQAQLKLLCDRIFGEENFVADVAVVNNFKGRSDARYIATAHEHLLIIKGLDYISLGVPVPDEYQEEYKLIDEFGKYRLLGLRKRGDNSRREDRPNLFYPIYYDFKSKEISIDNINTNSTVTIYPKLSNGDDGNWRWGKETVRTRLHELVVNIVKKRNEYDVFQKDYLHSSGDLKRIKPKSIWLGSEFSSDAGTRILKEIIPNSTFTSPKAVDLLKYCLNQSTLGDALVLDFFAGSGTTLHAVMALNAEDGGNRQCILVTNNENDIAEEVCYERNRRVIEGYTNSKGQSVPGLTNNHLHYYQTAYVGRERTLPNKRELMRLATELIAIKEGCFVEDKFPDDTIRLLKNDTKSQYVVIVNDEDAIPDAVELIQDLADTTATINVYVFAPGFYPYTDDFAEVADRISLVALPEAIYQAYARLLPPMGDPAHVVDEPEVNTPLPTADLTLFDLNA